MTHSRFASALFVVAALLVGALCFPLAAHAAAPFSWDGSHYVSADGSTPIYGAWARGIDVSYYQGDIDWNAVKADDVSFAIIRIYHWDEGAGKNSGVHVDTKWRQNADACDALGIPYGVYCYSEAHNVKEVLDEANAVVAELGGRRLGYPVYLDLEDADMASSDNAWMLGQMATAFCNRIYEAGYTPGVYSNLNWRRNFLTDPCFDQWTYWLAEWAHPEYGKFLPTYGGSYQLWQATSSGHVNGINGNVDIDFDFGVGPVRHVVDIPEDVAPGSMYRMYNPYSGEHFYTASSYEAQCINEVGWWYEGVGWVAPETSQTPVFRLYNPYGGDHHYTTSAYERDHLVSVGWIAEGVGWYSDDAQTVPLWRQYNPYAWCGTHNYTSSTQERDHLVSLGWRDEGVAWYGVA